MIDLSAAARRTAAVIVNVGADQLASPTPCPRYTVGDLLDHVDGRAQAFTDAVTKTFAAEGAQGPSGDASRLVVVLGRDPSWSPGHGRA